MGAHSYNQVIMGHALGLTIFLTGIIPRVEIFIKQMFVLCIKSVWNVWTVGWLVISSLQFVLVFVFYGYLLNNWNNGHRPVLTGGVCLQKCENKNFVNHSYFSWLHWDFMFGLIVALLLFKKIKLSSYNDNYMKELFGSSLSQKRPSWSLVGLKRIFKS